MLPSHPTGGPASQVTGGRGDRACQSLPSVSWVCHGSHLLASTPQVGLGHSQPCLCARGAPAVAVLVPRPAVGVWAPCRVLVNTYSVTLGKPESNSLRPVAEGAGPELCPGLVGSHLGLALGPQGLQVGQETGTGCRTAHHFCLTGLTLAGGTAL